jgi:hypothetical protein
MNRHFFPLLFACSFLFISFSTAHSNSTKWSVNAVLGDESFTETFLRAPNQYDSEELRITTHLRYVQRILRSTDISHLSSSQKENRAVLLAHLEEYTASGAFPKNYDYSDQRRPTFIDKDGNICAVGYLIEQTAGREVAEAINEEYKYEYVLNMESEIIDDWLYEYGITKTEAAMIQPAYGPVYGGERDVSSKELDVNYTLTSSALIGGQVVLTSLNQRANLSSQRHLTLSLINTGLGAATIIFGIDQYNDSERTYYEIEDPQAMWQVIYQINETNNTMKAISLGSVVAGSASVLFNTFQAIRFMGDKEQDPVAVTSGMHYLPGVSEPVPTLNLSVSF